jgi:hypothetical protein
MPLSRLTQTLPLDLAEATSESDAAPVGGALVAVFLAGAELAGAEFEAAVLAGELDGAIVDLLGGGVDGAEVVFEAGAMVESLEAVLLFRLFLLAVLASEPAVPAELPFPALAPAAAGWSLPAAVVSAFFLGLFFAVVPLSELALADWSALASVDFLLRLFLVVPLSEVVLAD